MNIGWSAPRRRGIILPTSLLELYLDSTLGLSGSHNSDLTQWPEQSGHSTARDAVNSTSGGNSGKMKLQTTSNLTPSGEQTVFFNGLDANSAAVGVSNTAFSWPSASSGYTFYVVFNALAAASGSGLQLLFNDLNADLRWVPDYTGHLYAYRDHAGTDRVTTSAYATGWQTARLVLRAAGLVDIYVNGVAASWTGGQPSWSLGSNTGYVVGNLATNFVVGQKMYLRAFLWYSTEHDAATQKNVDNYFRAKAGMTLL